jgi:hypothetical protein
MEGFSMRYSLQFGGPGVACISRAVAVLALLVVSTGAWSWNGRGHMMVAAVAWDLLEEPAQARASELLKLNPEYNNWVKGVSPADRGKTAFMKAATWPDFIRSVYKDDGSDPEKAPLASQNIGYEDELQHRYWHFVDMPFSQDDTALQQPKKPNALTQIVAFRNTIASREADDDLKSYDLVWLIHLVGDVHQPLHATARFSAASPKGDNGGNSVKLCSSPTSCNSDLHTFWDHSVGDASSVASIINAADSLDEAEPAAADIDNPETWIDESFKIARSAVYRRPIDKGNGPFVVTAAYKKSARGIAEERIVLAGSRLAKLLKDHLR